MTADVFAGRSEITSGEYRSMTITVHEVPSSVLFPNMARRSGFHAVSDAAAPLRASAKWEAVKAAMAVRSINGGAIFDGPVTVRVCVRWPKGRRMPDVEALSLACKPAVDGLQDALIFANDRQIAEICYRQERADDRIGCIEFVISDVLA